MIKFLLFVGVIGVGCWYCVNHFNIKGNFTVHYFP